MHLFAKNALECRFWLYYTTCIGGYYVSSDKVDYCMGYSSSSYPSYNHYHYHFYPQSTHYSYCPGRYSFAFLIGQFEDPMRSRNENRYKSIIVVIQKHLNFLEWHSMAFQFMVQCNGTHHRRARFIKTKKIAETVN